MIVLITAILIVLVLAVLLFPITISLNSAKSGETIKGSLGISWMIFFLSYTSTERLLGIHIFGRRVFHHISLEKKPQETEHLKDEKETGKILPIRDILDISGPILQLFKDIIHAVRYKYFDIEFTFGLSDPAYTGILTGFMHALRNSMGKDFKFTPDFTRKILEWNVRGKATIIPIDILASFVKFSANRKILRFAFQKVTRKAINKTFIIAANKRDKHEAFCPFSRTY